MQSPGDPDQLFQAAASEAFRARAVGWQAFGDLEFLVDMGVVLATAIVASAIVAYHPSLRSKARRVVELEQPKTFIMYAMVAAVIALIVRVQPNMALVVFGIGGLLRFRTVVGESKDTGRVILVTVVGLSCGLQLFVIACLATLVGVIAIWILERRVYEQLTVQGIAAESMTAALEAYKACVHASGSVVLNEELHMKKGSIHLVIQSPRQVDTETLSTAFAQIDASLRGSESWGGV